MDAGIERDSLVQQQITRKTTEYELSRWRSSVEDTVGQHGWDETVLQTFAKALSLEGYEVRTAASPLIGLQEAVETPPDAILLDLRMPFVNGVGFLYRLRAQVAHRHTPVAIITGDSCIDDPALSELHGLEAEVRRVSGRTSGRQVIGVSDPAYIETIAGALALLGTTHAVVVSSDDGIDQLFFGQLALDKLFKEVPRISRRREALQTKVCHSVLDGLAPEKALRDSYCSGCCRSIQDSR